MGIGKKSEIVLYKSVPHIVVIGFPLGNNVNVRGDSQKKGDGLSRGEANSSVSTRGTQRDQN